jgi:type I restriction enzyme S subunit
MRHKLGDICKFINGGSWAVSDYSDTGYPVLKVSNFQKDTFKFDEISYLKNENFPKYKKNQLQLHDLVIATVGSHPNLVNSSAGRSVSISKSIVGYLLNQNAVCLRTKNKNILNQRYLTYLGKTDYFQHFIQQRGKGAANQMRIAIGGIKDFEFDFPNIETQRKIATILSAYDDLIENNRRRITLLEEQAQLTYEEWFVRMRFPGFEKVEWDEELGLPMGWRKVKFGEICIVTGGGTPSRKIIDYWDSGNITWFSPTDLSKANSLYLMDSSQKITQLGLKKSSAKLLKKDSFMMTSRATIGLFGIIDKPFCTNQGFINITPFELYEKEFLLYNLMNRIDEFKGHATGSTFLELSRGNFKKLPIHFPNEDLLKAFHNKVSIIHQNIGNLTHQNRLLQEGRDILLPRLMLGLVDVEKMLGQVVEEVVKDY